MTIFFFVKYSISIRPLLYWYSKPSSWDNHKTTRVIKCVKTNRIHIKYCFQNFSCNIYNFLIFGGKKRDFEGKNYLTWIKHLCIKHINRMFFQHFCRGVFSCQACLSSSKVCFFPPQVINHTYSNWSFESCRYDWLSHISSCFVYVKHESKSVIVDRILGGQYSWEYCLLRFIRASFNSSLIKLEKLQTTIYRRKTHIIGVDDMNMFKGVLLFLTGQVDDRTIQKYEKESWGQKPSKL